MADQFFGFDPMFSKARESGKIRAGVSNEDIMRWMVMIVLSLTMLPDVGKDPEAEQDYLRKMLPPAFFN